MQGSVHLRQGLIVRDTLTPKGRGVFAGRNYYRGEVVEIAPVLLFQAAFSKLPGYLKHVVYDWGCLTGSESPVHAIALGVGSLLNHSENPNLSFAADPALLAIQFTAVREIPMGEELCIDYNHDIPPGGRDWFEELGIKRLETD